MPANVTPMMRQYLDIKEKHPDCMLFFRLGDFYEMFFEDAITASKELEIVLTGRDCGLDEKAPMCGIPYHSVDTYINRLIEKNYKVAICEQLTDPSESKGLVERDVIRIITPGTVIEQSMLTEGKNNYILSLSYDSGNCGIAYCDVSTGGFYTFELVKCGQSEILDEIERIQPKEIIASDALFLQEHIMRRLQSAYYISNYGGWAYETKKAEQRLCRHFSLNGLSGIGLEGKLYAISAAGSLIAYLEETQKNALTHISRLKYELRSEFMCMDASTRRNLELTHPIRIDASKKSTMLYVLDHTMTSMGSRLIRNWIDQPLQKQEEINSRLDAVEEILDAQILRVGLRKVLDSILDIERLSSKIAYSTINARDCNGIAQTLSSIPDLIDIAKHFTCAALAQIADDLDPMTDIYSLLRNSIADNPPTGVKDGGIIREGYNEELDKLREISHNAKTWLNQLESKERANTGIKTLKIGFNRVFGYYFEVSKSYMDMVPYTFIRKQTLSNGERYVTEELKELESTILNADEKSIALEYRLFGEIRDMLINCIDRLQKDSALIAKLDVLQGFAELAAMNRYVRPAINSSNIVEITEGRHPVVENGIKEGFIPNNTLLDNDENRMLIITGPNMAGKSTYMRQVALIVLMAHMGSFVPAKKADICLCDRIFTRIGASDNLASGQSTFMVEMSETALILNNATKNSLIILDEIGRGTSTFDGLSIAWAVLESILDKSVCGAKTLFATHYHELTELEGKLEGIKNYRISVKEVGEDIIFLRKVIRGGADKSFGIQVASLAGLPESVIKRAKEVLKRLEESEISHTYVASNVLKQESTFTLQPSLFPQDASSEILNTLSELDINSITPFEALNLLYELHQKSRSEQHEQD